MIVTPLIALRIAAILVLAVIVQVSFLSFVAPLGAIVNVLPVVAASLGLLGGAVLGAGCGFATGLLLDSVQMSTLGVGALSLLAVGFAAGRFREGFGITSSLTPPLVVGGATTLGAALLAAIQVTLGVGSQVSLLVLREIVLQGLFALVLAVPVLALVRRALRPALIEDEPVVGPAPSGAVRARPLSGGRRRRRRGGRDRAGSGRPLGGGVA